MRCRAVSLALIATQHVTLDVRGHAGPPVVARDEFERAMLAWMASGGRVVAGLDDVVAERRAVRDVELAFVVQEAVVLFPF